jgi:hypothetical protein
VHYSPLAGRPQDGKILNVIFNDKEKDSAAEDEETVSFSEVFHRLDRAGTLCPSNYIVEVIKGLEKYDADHNTRHSEQFYCETVARSMRSFASFIREENLREIIDHVLKIEAIRRRKGYKMFEGNVQEDMKKKTDIMFKYGGAFYRIWSYQTTDSGVKKTSKRILKGCGRGLNVLMPFDITCADETFGWALYDYDETKQLMLDMIVNRRFVVQTYVKYKKLVEVDKNIIKTPTIFDAA